MVEIISILELWDGAGELSLSSKVFETAFDSHIHRDCFWNIMYFFSKFRQYLMLGLVVLFLNNREIPFHWIVDRLRILGIYCLAIYLNGHG